VAAPKAKKLTNKEQRELDEMPRQIAQLEAEQKSITQQLANPALYKDQPDEVRRLNQRFAEIDTEMLDKLEKWETIEARTKG
jgi:ATP-binding cassette subfamily F protein uup